MGAIRLADGRERRLSRPCLLVAPDKVDTLLARGADPMTQALSDAVASAAKLPEAEQNALAAILVEEMASEERWNALFSDSRSLLERLASEAIHENEKGAVQPSDQLR
jgi:hypothetical protein